MTTVRLSLLATIKKHHTVARFAKDEKQLTFLTTLYAEAARPGLDDGKRESTNEEVLAVIRKFIKGANDIVSRVPDSPAGHTAKWELNLLNDYLPKQLSKEDIFKVIGVALDPANVTIKAVMDIFKKQFPGQYDSKLLMDCVKEVLAKAQEAKVE